MNQFVSGHGSALKPLQVIEHQQLDSAIPAAELRPATFLVVPGRFEAGFHKLGSIKVSNG
jgi:hypothetical protein